MTSPNPRIRPYGAAALAEAAAAIRRGGIVAVPTETVYGLAADARNGAAVARIYAAKGRPSFNPLIVHVPDVAAARGIARFDTRAERIAAAFWPGPLTQVLPLAADAGIAGIVTAGLDTVAIRIPAHRAMQGLLAESGAALAAPSANASGRISPTRAEHVAASLGDAVDLIIDDGRTIAGIESTIVMADRILRPGSVTAEALAEFGIVADGRDGAIVAPGQLASHYAPDKPVRLDAVAAGADEWLIGFGAVGGDDTLSAAGDPVEAAANLFDALHRADAAGHARIAVAPIPNHGVGVAINDRLRRAAYSP